MRLAAAPVRIWGAAAFPRLHAREAGAPGARLYENFTVLFHLYYRNITDFRELLTRCLIQLNIGRWYVF